MRAPAHGEGIGAAVRRVEDARYLLGRARYVADITVPGELYCVLVRSPHAHAAIRAIDTAPALVRPGVAACFTA